MTEGFLMSAPNRRCDAGNHESITSGKSKVEGRSVKEGSIECGNFRARINWNLSAFSVTKLRIFTRRDLRDCVEVGTCAEYRGSASGPENAVIQKVRTN